MGFQTDFWIIESAPWAFRFLIYSYSLVRGMYVAFQRAFKRMWHISELLHVTIHGPNSRRTADNRSSFPFWQGGVNPRQWRRRRRRTLISVSFLASSLPSQCQPITWVVLKALNAGAPPPSDICMYASLPHLCHSFLQPCRYIQGVLLRLLLLHVHL